MDEDKQEKEKLKSQLKGLTKEVAKSNNMTATVLSGFMGVFILQTNKIGEQLTRIADALNNPKPNFSMEWGHNPADAIGKEDNPKQ